MFLTTNTVIILKPIQIAPCAKISVTGIVIVGRLNVVAIKIILSVFGGKSTSASTKIHQILSHTIQSNISMAILVTKVINILLH